jgi:hypothetical protein
VGPIDSEFASLEDEGHGRSGAFVDLGAEVFQIGLDLLPVKARIKPAYLLEGIAVLSHGTMV